MSDAHIITWRQWQQLHAEMLYERAVARRRLAEAHTSTYEYWTGYEAACKTMLNTMRRITEHGPNRGIEDIITS